MNRYKLAMFALIFSTIGLIYISYALFYPFNPVNTDQPIKVESKLIKKGDKFVYLPYTCRNTNAPSTVERFYENGMQYPLTEVSVLAEPFTCKQYRIVLDVPDILENGIYHLKIRIKTQINAFRLITQTYYTEDFEIKR